MPVKIIVPTPMQRYTMNHDEVEVGGATVDSALHHLSRTTRTCRSISSATTASCAIL